MKHILFFAAIIAVLLNSCGRGSSSKMELSDVQLTPVQQAKASTAKAFKSDAGDGMINAASADSTAAAPGSASPIIPQAGIPVDPDWDKKIIKTANVTLELKDYNTYNTAIHAKVKSNGAYIAQEQQTETDNQLMNEITIKVPVDKFDDVMNSFAGDGIKVVGKNISTQDVTGEVVDTKARLEAKKEVRDRYLQLLKQANNMKDILAVQDEINSIQEDIESAAGRVGFLTHSAAYSTINVKYYQFLNGVTAREIEPNFITKTGEAFKTGGEIITNIILFIISVWPLAIATVMLVVYFKKSNRKKVKEV